MTAASPALAGGEVVLRVDPGDPCLPGHFPGRPLLPGVLLLDALAGALERAHPRLAMLALEAVKFTAPVLPGQEVVLRWTATAPGRAAFQAEAAGVRVLTGRAAWTAAAPGTRT